MRFRGLAFIATLYLICQMGPMGQPAIAQSFLDSIVPGQVVSQAVYNLLPPELRALVRVAGAGGSNNPNLNSRGLPYATLDSFVYQAGSRKEEIYGDEGVNGLPPINGFNAQNRIDYGIFGTRNAGITTGHGSLMPAAWGWADGTNNEWALTGDKSGNQMPVYVPQNPLTAGGILNSVTTGLGVGTERPGEMAPVTIADPSINYDRNAPDFIRNFGMWATEVVPYPVTPDMKPVQNNETHALMGWIAPGESVGDFLSGKTGRLIPSQAGAAASMLNQLNGQQSTFSLPSTSSQAAGF
ncbi:hypothetical protein BH11CYA1_BH11CYA1_38380 [soil metagenome]